MRVAELGLVLAWVAAAQVARAQAPTFADESAPALSLQASPRVVEVVVHAPKQFTAAQLVNARSQIGIWPGDQFSSDAVRDAVERLFASGEFSDVVVWSAPRRGGIALTDVSRGSEARPRRCVRGRS